MQRRECVQNVRRNLLSRRHPHGELPLSPEERRHDAERGSPWLSCALNIKNATHMAWGITVNPNSRVLISDADGLTITPVLGYRGADRQLEQRYSNKRISLEGDQRLAAGYTAEKQWKIPQLGHGYWGEERHAESVESYCRQQWHPRIQAPISLIRSLSLGGAVIDISSRLCLALVRCTLISVRRWAGGI